jgi:hypothetical protein
MTVEYHRQEKKVVFHQQTSAEETVGLSLSFLILLSALLAMLVPCLVDVSTSLKICQRVFVYPPNFRQDHRLVRTMQM